MIPRPHGPPTRRRAGSIRVGVGTVRETSYGTYLAYLRVGGIRRRRCFESFAAAERWISAEEKGLPLPGLTAGQYLDAQTALLLLPPDVSLADCARDFVRIHGVGGRSQSVRLSDAIAGFTKERGVSITPRTMESYRQAFRDLADELRTDPLLATISADDLERVVASESGATRNTRISRLGVLFSWAERKGYIAANPLKRIARARKVEAPLGVFTPDEAARVLHATERIAPSCVPYLAVGFFAGIRPAELHRLTRENFTSRYIRLDGKITKAARARTVEIRPNLAAWLAKYPWRKPPVRAKNTIPNDVCRAAGVTWKSDVMRHSFATYAYELCKDAAAVAAEMGHRGTGVFFTHYRALAEPGDGEKYFSISPTKGD